MHRAILQACLPCLLTLIASFTVLTLVVKLSGARVNWRRLGRLHRCEDGGVQSLAFVLTLPIFLMIVSFIVQVSQLMIATMVVHYAAFAAARSASVWIPANVIGSRFTIDEPENVLPAPISTDNPVLLIFDESRRSQRDRNIDVWEYRATSSTPRSGKYAYVYTAAAMACLPLAPSRDLGYENALQNESVADATKTLYRLLVPHSQSNARIPKRLENKIIYSFNNTSVRLEFVDKDSERGPTYNPRSPVWTVMEDGTFAGVRVWNPHEVGWQDPVTVTVTHHFALLPGPGRFLAKYLLRADGEPDRVSPRIGRFTAGNRERVYTTPVWASATMTNEGFQSTIPYVQQTD